MTDGLWQGRGGSGGAGRLLIDLGASAGRFL